MTSAGDNFNLTGQLLIAMPSMLDPRFIGSVIFICAQSEEGAMGLIINKPAQDVSVREVFDQLNLSHGTLPIELPIYFGGPVEHARGFVLHSPDYTSDLHTLDVDGVFSMTGTIDILENMAKGRGPSDALLMLGYAGWGPDQLETEIMGNGWLTCPASPELVFETEDDLKWACALDKIGVDPVGLSAVSGRA